MYINPHHEQRRGFFTSLQHWDAALPRKVLRLPHRLALKLGLLLTVILALGKLRQVHREFKVSLGYIASLSQNIKTKGWLSKISCLLWTGFMWADNFKKKKNPS